MKCQECSKEFESKAHNAKFCCKRCSNKHWKSCNKDKMREYNLNSKEYKKRWYIKNKERIKKKKENNKQHLKVYNKHWQEQNKDKVHQYRIKNKEKYRKRRKERYQDDVQYKIKKNLRTRLNIALKNNHKSGSAVKDLGCSIEDFKCYLESKFDAPMSWDNYGQWHIDHVQPLASFDLTDREQLKKACHYSNLQPLWAKDNLQKSNKITN